MKSPLRAFLLRLYSLPPLRFARVILKNHPKNGRFGLHKSGFFVFMRAMRRARTVFGDYKWSAAKRKSVTSCKPPLCKGRWVGNVSSQAGGVVGTEISPLAALGRNDKT